MENEQQKMDGKKVCGCGECIQCRGFFESKANTILLSTFIVLMVIALMVIWPKNTNYVKEAPVVTPVTDNSEETTLSNKKRFSGTITDRDDACFADGLCFIEIDNTYWVLHTQGWTATLGTVEGELEIGKKVDVYAEKYTEESSYSNTYSIIDDEKYYINVIQ